MLAMIVDDSRSSLSRLRELVELTSEVRAATFLDPEAAFQSVEHDRYDMAIVDHVMPGMDGITFIRHLRATRGHEQIPVLMLTGTVDDSVRLSALDAGATDFLNKMQSPLEIKVRLRNLIALSNALRKLDDHVADKTREIDRATMTLLRREEETIFFLSKALEFRDNDTRDHTLRVANYSRMIAEQLGLPQEECRSLFLAAPLHDIGKVAIPDGILLKPGRLDETERRTINTHAAIGAHILSGSTSDLLRLAAQIAESHHERWDGTGYPRGLAGESIPLCARIVAIADVFDALTTERPYKPPFAIGDALELLDAERGRHFDPVCLDAFLRAYARSRDRDLPASSARARPEVAAPRPTMSSR